MEKEIIALRDENKITKVTHDIKTRCEIINSIFERLRNIGAIQDETSDERMKLYADEYNKFSVNTLKADIQQAFRKESQSFKNVLIRNEFEAMEEKAIRVAERSVETLESELQRRRFDLYKRYNPADAPKYYTCKNGILEVDCKAIERSFSIILDSEPQKAFIERARKLQQEIARFDNFCRLLGVRGVSHDQSNCIICSDSDGVWWLDLRPMTDMDITEKGIDEVLTSSALDNIKECSYEL